MEISIVGLQVHEHQDEEVQDEDRTGVGDDLHGPDKLGVEEDEESGDMDQQGQECNAAMHGVSERKRQDACSNTDESEIGKKDDNHRLSPDAWVAVESASVPIAGSNTDIPCFPQRSFPDYARISIFLHPQDVARRFRTIASCQTARCVCHGSKTRTSSSSPAR